MMDISVIIPVYNVEKYIKRCFESLFRQTKEDNIEFIIINDCSPDNSIVLINKILENYPKRKSQVQIIDHFQNRGLAAARNTGMAYAKGKYILHVDSDDWLEFDMISSMFNIAEKNEADIVTCDFYGAYANKEIYYPQYIPLDSYAFFIKMLNGTAHYAPWNKLIRRTLYDKINPLWLEGVNMWEDVSVMPRLVFYANKIIHISKPLYHYNQSNVNSYSKKWNESNILNIIAAVNEIRRFTYSVVKSDNIKHNILMLKGHAKFAILAHCPKMLISKYKKIFPEFKRTNLWDIELPIYKKIIFFLFLSSNVRIGQFVFKKIEEIKNWIR